MNQNLDLIASVNIDISAPVAKESFDHLLIIGPMPSNTAKHPEPFAEYKSLDEVVAAGWVASGTNTDPIGVAAKVAFAQNPAPDKIYIAPKQTVESVTESSAAVAERALEFDGWYIVCTTEIQEVPALAAKIETTEKLCFYSERGNTQPIVTGHPNRTAGIFCKEASDQATADIPEENKYMDVAFAVKLLSYPSGSETAAFKQLELVKPAKLSTTTINLIKSADLNYFTSVGGKNITMEGRVLSGEWIDVIRFRDWLKNDMQTRVVKLFIDNPKITLNDAGITLIQNQMMASLKAGQDAGGIAQDEFDEDGNEIPGYSVTVPKASELTDVEKASRSLDGFTFEACIAGAIHFAALKGNLVYSLS